MKNYTPSAWPTIVLYPLAFLAAPVLMVVQRIRKGYWA